MKDLKISIITVSYNSEHLIEKTINSVISQSAVNFEYIIIDGGSTDSTLSVIEKYRDSIATVISEKDSGLYDAMNKGIKLARGQYINFMNCGDIFVNNNVLSSVAKYLDDSIDVIYGNVNILTPNGMYNISPLPLESIVNQMPFCHQAAFVKREVLLNNLFDTNYRFLADFNQFRTLYINHASFFYCPVTVAYYQIGEGQTNDNRLKSYYELVKITNAEISFWAVNKYRMTDFLLRLLPKSIINLIRKKNYISNPNIHQTIS